MPDCEALDTCLFFNDKIQGMPATAQVFKNRYCRGDKIACARYMVLVEVGREYVPTDLFPNQVERAEQIIDEARG